MSIPTWSIATNANFLKAHQFQLEQRTCFREARRIVSATYFVSALAAANSSLAHVARCGVNAKTSSICVFVQVIRRLQMWPLVSTARVRHIYRLSLETNTMAPKPLLQG